MTTHIASFIASQFFVLGMEAPAEAHLARELRSRPSDPALLALRGDIARSRGHLDAAREAFVGASAAGGDSRHRYLAAVLSAQVPDVAPPAGVVWPAPFVQKREFLPAALRAELMEFALAHFERFVPASVTGEQWNESETPVRQGRCIDVLDTFQAPFGAYLGEGLREVVDRLQIAPFARDGFELQMTRYGDGDFFTAHRDVEITDPDAEESGRRVAFVYYFSRRPRPFSGGDLLLYDSDRSSPAADPTRFTRLQPEDNSIALFPTDVLHEVMPVSCPSGDVADGRFTINGWVHA